MRGSAAEILDFNDATKNVTGENKNLSSAKAKISAQVFAPSFLRIGKEKYSESADNDSEQSDDRGVVLFKPMPKAGHIDQEQGEELSWRLVAIGYTALVNAVLKRL